MLLHLLLCPELLEEATDLWLEAAIDWLQMALSQDSSHIVPRLSGAAALQHVAPDVASCHIRNTSHALMNSAAACKCQARAEATVNKSPHVESLSEPLPAG